MGAAAPVRAHLVCGGRWHDFDFARRELLAALGRHDHVRTTVAEDHRALHRLAAAEVLVTYTCDVRPSVEEQRALARWVADGGRWLALHGTNAVIDHDGTRYTAPRVINGLREVLGSQFVAHPPVAPYEVEVVAPDHPLVRGLSSFTVEDELYLSEIPDPSAIEVLLATRWTGDSGPGFAERSWPDDDPRPVLYLHRYGEGEVVYLTLGHCRGHWDMQPEVERYPRVERGSWDVPEFRTVLGRALRWVVDPPGPTDGRS